MQGTHLNREECYVYLEMLCIFRNVDDLNCSPPSQNKRHNLWLNCSMILGLLKYTNKKCLFNKCNLQGLSSQLQNQHSCLINAPKYYHWSLKSLNTSFMHLILPALVHNWLFTSDLKMSSNPNIKRALSVLVNCQSTRRTGNKGTNSIS